MKKVLYFCIFSLSLLINNSVKAQNCPTGWNLWQEPINLNGCEYMLSFCFKCGITGNDPANIQNATWEPMDPNSTCMKDDPQFKDQIEHRITQIYFNFCNIPNCEQGPPLEVKMAFSLCSKWVHYPVFQNGIWYHHIYHTFCEYQNSYCLVTYHICRDINGIIQSHKANCIIIGDIESNDTKIDKPIPNQTTPPAGFNWYQNWETDCFKDVDCML